MRPDFSYGAATLVEDPCPDEHEATPHGGEPAPPSPSGVARAATGFLSAIVVLVCWAFSSPVGSSPDDDFHLASVWCAAGQQGPLCSVGNTPDSRLVPLELVEGSVCYRVRPQVSAGCQGDIADWTGQDLVSTDRLNTTGLYPPGYYRAMHVGVGADTKRSALFLRLINIAAAVSALLLVMAVSTTAVRSALAKSWVLASLPLGVFVLASSNPSAWAIIGIGTFWAAFYTAATTDGGARRVGASVAAVVLGAVASAARADAAVYVPMCALAVVVASGAWRARRRLLSAPVVAVGATSTLISATVFLTASQSHVATTGFTEERFEPSGLPMLLHNTSRIHELLLGFFGFGWGLGWLDTPIPTVAGLLFLTSIAFVLRPSRAAALDDLWLTVAGLVAAVVIVPIAILQLGQTIVERQLLQPRYLLPLIYPILGLAFLATGSRASSSLTRAAVVLAAIGHSIALHATIRRYVTGTDVSDWNLDRDVEWWWDAGVSPMALWLAATLAFLALAHIVLTWPETNVDATVAL